MKVVAKPISVYSWIDVKGIVHPERLILIEKNVVKELTIDNVVNMTKERLEGNPMLIFNCESEIRGIVRPYVLKYELSACKWMLFKI